MNIDPSNQINFDLCKLNVPLIPSLAKKNVAVDEILSELPDGINPFVASWDQRTLFEHLLAWAVQALEADRQTLFHEFFHKYRDFLMRDLRFENDQNLLHLLVTHNLSSLPKALPEEIRHLIFFEWKWQETSSQVLGMSPLDFSEIGEKSTFFDPYTRTFWQELENTGKVKTSLPTARFEATSANLQKALGWVLGSDQPLAALGLIISHFNAFAHSDWSDPVSKKPILHAIVQHHCIQENTLIEFLQWLAESDCRKLLSMTWNGQALIDLFMDQGNFAVVRRFCDILDNVEDSSPQRNRGLHWLSSMEQAIRLFETFMRSPDEVALQLDAGEKVALYKSLFGLRQEGGSLFFALMKQPKPLDLLKKLCGDPFDPALLEHLQRLPLNSSHPLSCSQKQNSSLLHWLIECEKWNCLLFFTRSFPLDSPFWAWQDGCGKIPREAMVEKSKHCVQSPPEELLAFFDISAPQIPKADAELTKAFFDIISGNPLDNELYYPQPVLDEDDENFDESADAFRALFNEGHNKWVEILRQLREKKLTPATALSRINDTLIDYAHQLGEPPSKKFFQVDLVKNQNILHAVAGFNDKHDALILNTFHDFLYESFSWLLNQKDAEGKTPIDLLIEDGRFSLLIDLREDLSQRILASIDDSLLMEEEGKLSCTHKHEKLLRVYLDGFEKPDTFDEQADLARKQIDRWFDDYQILLRCYTNLTLGVNGDLEDFILTQYTEPEDQAATPLSYVLDNHFDALLRIKYRHKSFLHILFEQYCKMKAANLTKGHQVLLDFIVGLLKKDRNKVSARLAPLKKISPFSDWMEAILPDLRLVYPEEYKWLLKFSAFKPTEMQKRKRVSLDDLILQLEQLSKPFLTNQNRLRAIVKQAILDSEDRIDALGRILQVVALPPGFTIEDPTVLYEDCYCRPILIGEEEIANANLFLRRQGNPTVQAFPPLNLAHLAIQQGDKGLLTLLLETGLASAPSDQTLYLCHAIQHTHLDNWKAQLEIMELLIKHSAKVDEMNYRGWTPLILLLFEKFELLDDPSASTALLSFFEKHGANPYVEEKEYAILSEVKGKWLYSPDQWRCPLVLLSIALNAVEKREKRGHLVPILERWLAKIPEESRYASGITAEGKRFLTSKQK